MKKLLMLSAAALVLSAGGAFAERGEGGDGPGHHKGERHEKRMEKMFDKKDIDGDGAISQDEHNKASDEWFKEMDADGDGKVTTTIGSGTGGYASSAAVQPDGMPGTVAEVR